MNKADLIKALENAPEGSRELDEAIGRLQGYEYGKNIGSSPHYTTSLDAALTLVPEGWAGSVDVPGQDNGAWLDPPGHGAIGDKRVYAVGASPALALCIAALKAMQPTQAPPAQPDTDAPRSKPGR